ncbi:hypothetical protein HOY80DRAFT_438964 [Tuber brumale]|nr:hypothetical protein HOY80DRAFT_438964 [Tuber brumale]
MDGCVDMIYLHSNLLFFYYYYYYYYYLLPFTYYYCCCVSLLLTSSFLSFSFCDWIGLRLRGFWYY